MNEENQQIRLRVLNCMETEVDSDPLQEILAEPIQDQEQSLSALYFYQAFHPYSVEDDEQYHSLLEQIRQSQYLIMKIKYYRNHFF